MNLWLIAGLALAIMLLSVVPGLYFWWPSRGEPASRSDLGVALMTGALIALGVLALQVVLDSRLQKVEDDRQAAQEEQALKLQLALQTRLIGVPLERKNLNGIYLYEKKMRNANLRSSDLTGAVLTRNLASFALLAAITAARASAVPGPSVTSCISAIMETRSEIGPSF